MDEYNRFVENDTRRMEEIDNELIALLQGSDDSEMTAVHLLKLASNAKELFKSSKPAVKNQFLRVFVSNLEINQKRLNFNPLEPLSFLTFMDFRPTWLPILDDFRIACHEYDKKKELSMFVQKYLS